MAWKVRHEGSPQSIDGLSLAEIVQGIEDGRWEPTDEVQGPGEAEWVAIEAHPQLAETVADYEPPPSKSYDDETRLDMNALIDVTLVLLIFFILTATYSVLLKRFDLPPVSTDPIGKAVVTKEIRETSILVEVKREGDRTVYLVEDKEVSVDNLPLELQRRAGQGGKKTLLLKHDNEVTHGDVVKVQDAARGVRPPLEHILLVVPDKK